MYLFASYILKVTIFSGILYGYYFIALRNKVFHSWNRFYLLTAIIFSVVVPLIEININGNNTLSSSGIAEVIKTVDTGRGQIYLQSKGIHESFDFYNMVLLVYSIISLVLLINLVKTFIHLFKLKAKAPKIFRDGVELICTSAEGTPFSFFKTIFWNDQIEINSPSGKQIINHELTHITEYHTYDKIYINIIIVLLWANPFFWLIRKELSLIHEFIADQKTSLNFNTASLAKLILKSVYPRQQFNLTNSFFQSPIKRRLFMITKNKSSKISYVSRIFALIITIVLFLSFTLKMNSGPSSPFSGSKLSQKTEPKGNMYADTKNNISIQSDIFVNVTDPNRTYANIMKGVLIIDGQVQQNERFRNKYIVCKKLTIHSGDELNIISTYGANAQYGVFEISNMQTIKENRAMASDNNQKLSGELLFTKVENPAEFPGGNTAWLKYLHHSMEKYVNDLMASSSNQGTCIVEFTVKKDGSISDVRPITMLRTKLAEVSVNLIQLSGRWNPGIQNGHKVNSVITVPISFKSNDKIGINGEPQ